MDSMISPEMPPEVYPELLEHLRKFKIHRHSPYGCGRTRNQICRFNHYYMAITPQTYICHICNRVTYLRRHQDDLNVAPYISDLTIYYLAHIHLERPQASGVVDYLMKYSFKPPTSVDATVETM